MVCGCGQNVDVGALGAGDVMLQRELTSLSLFFFSVGEKNPQGSECFLPFFGEFLFLVGGGGGVARLIPSGGGGVPLLFPSTAAPPSLLPFLFLR